MGGGYLPRITYTHTHVKKGVSWRRGAAMVVAGAVNVLLGAACWTAWPRAFDPDLRVTHGYLLYPKYRYRYRLEPSIRILNTWAMKYLCPKYLCIKYPRCIRSITHFMCGGGGGCSPCTHLSLLPPPCTLLSLSLHPCSLAPFCPPPSNLRPTHPPPCCLLPPLLSKQIGTFCDPEALWRFGAC